MQVQVQVQEPPGSEGREAVGHGLLHLLAGGGQGVDQLPYDWPDLRGDDKIK